MSDDGRWWAIGALGLLAGSSILTRGSRGAVRRGREATAPSSSGIILTSDENPGWSMALQGELTTGGPGNAGPPGLYAGPEDYRESRVARPTQIPPGPTRTEVEGWDLLGAAEHPTQFLTLRAPHGIQIHTSHGHTWSQGTWGQKAFTWVKLAPNMVITPGRNDPTHGNYQLLTRFGGQGRWIGEADNPWHLRFRAAPAPSGSPGVVRRGQSTNALDRLRELGLRFVWSESAQAVTELWSGETLIALLDGKQKPFNYFIGNLADAGLGLVIRLPAWLDYPSRTPIHEIRLGSHRGNRPGVDDENVMIVWENPAIGANNAFVLRGNRPELFEAMQAIAAALGVPATWSHR